VNGAKIFAQGGVRIGLGTIMTCYVLVEPGGRYIEHAAKNGQRVVSPLGGNKGVLHRDSLAKNTAAFFNISLSIFSAAFSARSREFSDSISLTSRRLAEDIGLPCRAVATQLANDLTEIPSFRAAAVRPMLSDSATA